MNIPFFRVNLGEEEISEVVETLRSGWLTTGPKTRQFEAAFADATGAKHAIALNSCTAALHLALEAIGLERGEIVVVPALTFAATAEVVRYFDAIPIFVDCDESLNMSPIALEETLTALNENRPVPGGRPPYRKVRAIIPMHYGGYCCDMDRIETTATKFGIDLIEDAAHAFPASYRPEPASNWTPAGRLSRIGCYSFYANKCITTGEGGMAVTDEDGLAERIRLMSLHGMNRNAWSRFTEQGSWFYEIVAPGYKYNLTDMASAIGLVQLRKAESLRRLREEIAKQYNDAFLSSPTLEVPPNDPETRLHPWHLYSLRLHLEHLTINRDQFIDELKQRGVRCSVHWYPLPLNPYYREAFRTGPGQFPHAENEWLRMLSLPLFPTMRSDEVDYVIASVLAIVGEFSH